MINRPTIPSAELPAGTVIELPPYGGNGPWRVRLVERATFGGDGTHPGWRITDRDDGGASAVHDATIDAGYTIVSEANLPGSAAKIDSKDLWPGTVIDLSHPDGSSYRYTLVARSEDVDGWTCKEGEGAFPECPWLLDRSIDENAYTIVTEPSTPSKDLAPGTEMMIGDGKYTLLSRLDEHYPPGWHVYDHTAGQPSVLLDGAIDNAYGYTLLEPEAANETLRTVTGGFTEPDLPEATWTVERDLPTGDGRYQVARFAENHKTWDRIKEVLQLPHDRFLPIQLRTDDATGVVYARLEIMLTPDELIALANIAAGRP